MGVCKWLRSKTCFPVSCLSFAAPDSCGSLHLADVVKARRMSRGEDSWGSGGVLEEGLLVARCAVSPGSWRAEPAEAPGTRCHCSSMLEQPPVHFLGCEWKVAVGGKGLWIWFALCHFTSCSHELGDKQELDLKAFSHSMSFNHWAQSWGRHHQAFPSWVGVSQLWSAVLELLKPWHSGKQVGCSAPYYLSAKRCLYLQPLTGRIGWELY